MNENIEKLVSCIPTDTSGRWVAIGDMEKFAELIVEEMYDFIMEESANDNGIPDLGKIKEHFGIEE